MEFITQHAQDILQGATALVTFFSVLANFTKTDADNKAVSLIGRLVNFFALNIAVKK